MYRFTFLLLSILLLTGRVVPQTPDRPATEPLTKERLEHQVEGNFGADDIAASSAFAESLGIADWLGPLAPVALSPFFGVTCLSGLALWGPEWVTDNALLGKAGPLQNETLFFIFLALTLLTSLPRLTKDGTRPNRTASRSARRGRRVCVTSGRKQYGCGRKF